MLAVYAEHIGERLRYVCDVVLRRGLLTEVQLFQNAADFTAFQGPKINYSHRDDLPGLHIQPVGLLKEHGIREHEPGINSWQSMPALYPSKGKLPFDLFSAAFYLLSRYEEYLPSARDEMGRFLGKQGFASRNELLEIPLIDQWVKALHELLTASEGYTKPWRHRYRFQSTIDIDSAFAYKHKGFYRTTGGFAKDLIKGDFKNFLRRFNCLTGRMQDPYDVYHIFDALHLAEIDVKYFFLLADFGKYDKGVPHKSRALHALAGRMHEHHGVGIHPGVRSNTDDRALQNEIARLTSITGERVRSSRQHYLILNFPDTYRRLMAAGIEEDHSMGFADTVGFRAGTSRPFPFYDLDAEKSTLLMLHPFSVMDATLQRYMGYSPEKSIDKLKQINQSVREVEGDFRILWHNESLSEDGPWKGWRRVYEALIEIGK